MVLFVPDAKRGHAVRHLAPWLWVSVRREPATVLIPTWWPRSGSWIPRRPPTLRAVAPKTYELAASRWCSREVGLGKAVVGGVLGYVEPRGTRLAVFWDFVGLCVRPHTCNTHIRRGRPLDWCRKWYVDEHAAGTATTTIRQSVTVRGSHSPATCTAGEIFKLCWRII
jgi:hypothetical protein